MSEHTVTYIDIDDADDAGQRIDNFLLKHLKGVPRSFVYRILRSGEVRVNSGRVKASYRLSVGDRVRIPPARRASAVQPRLATGLAATLAAAVIYEDDDYLAINKPSGIAVHGGSNVTAGVVETLRLARDEPRLELVHRIDRDTSGCLLLARNRKSLAAAQAQFRERTVGKQYDLLVWGQWPRALGVVRKRLARYETKWGERRVRVDSNGQSARTDFAVVQQCAAATWLRASLHTGRTHQIRVHAAANGYPIVGDEKYDERRRERPELGSVEQRLCLHASKLTLRLADREIRLKTAVAPGLEDLWRVLDDPDTGLVQ